MNGNPAEIRDPIDSDDDVLAMLDDWLAPRDPNWWNGFYADRAKPCPFFVPDPDQSLGDQLANGQLPRGRALDLGCGNGRNAIHLARQGFDVTGVDHASTAIDWAREQAAQAGVAVQWQCQSVFELQVEPGSQALVYDSGCFHHLAPHRRHHYVQLVARALQPGGWFGLACFRPEGGSGLSDRQVYERRSLGGGLGYSEQRLRTIWSRALQVRAIRQMPEAAPGSGWFSAPFLWSLWAQRVDDDPPAGSAG